MHIVRNELPVPQELAALGFEGNERVRIEIGARSDLAIKVGRRIANREIDDTGFHIQRHWRPQATPSVLQRLGVLPGLGGGLAWIGNEIEFPDLLAIIELKHVERDQVAVSRAAHELPILDGSAAIGWRDLLALGLPDIGPALTAGVGVDRDCGAPEGEIHHALIDEWTRLHRSRLL